MTATRRTALALFSLGYGIALYHGQLEPAALGAIGLLLIAAIAVRPARPIPIRWMGHGLFIVTGLALALHALPGFNNASLMALTRSSPEAEPFITYWNLDKPLIGLWILLACPWVLQRVDPVRALKVGAGATLLVTSLCLTLAWALGVIGWSPKWPPYSLMWLLNNLLLVSLTEELFFRAYLQGALQRYCHRWSAGGILPVVTVALLFGLAHIGGGWAWVLLAGLAGVGYGIAWRYGGLWAAVIAHFGLNLVHFTLFAYPMLAR